ncbi:MAG: ammonium transporter [Pseudomonadota bacterium]|nr:ammonium transporter [Pseudomonadota bacterium]
MSSAPTLLDTAWLVVAAGMVFMMQGGFCALEAGFVRARNTINVAAKNVVDFCITGALFWAFGFLLMFGPTDPAVSGDNNGWATAFELFQLMFCGTAVTLVSGAVAERIRFLGYLLVSVVVAALIYPVTGGWAWAGMNGGEAGWLEARGFIDFAGSTVVHSVGGWASLAAILVIGARTGRFANGTRPPQPHNLPLTAFGMMFIWFGWIGFNGGSTLFMDDQVAPIVLHTMLAGCFGGLGGLGAAVLAERKLAVDALLNGVLGGLVAITASVHVVESSEAALIGAVGGFLVVPAGFLLARLRIDDAINVIPVHLVAGIWGTLCVAFFGNPEMTGKPWLEQLQIQALGIVVIGAWAFGVSFVMIRLLSLFVRLRATVEEERVGLNISEHQATSAALDLVDAMEQHFQSGRLTDPVPVEVGSEVEMVARQYNRVALRVRADKERMERTVRELEAAKTEAEAASRAKSSFLANMSHELRTPLNAVIGFSQLMTSRTFGPLGDTRYEEYARDIQDAGTHLLNLVNDLLDHSSIESKKMELKEREIDLQYAISAAVRFVEPAGARGQVTLAQHVPEDMPELYADERLVRQVLINLLSNSVKFTEPGGRVEVSARKEPDGRIALVVADTGIGMKREDIERAMEPFVQLNDSYDKRYGGTGLGLPLVKSMVQLHGGTMTIDSIKGNGTTVIVRFPEARTVKMLTDAAD